MLVRVLCCVVAWIPLRIWEATGLPVCVASIIIIIIIIECGKRKPSPATSISSQQPLAGSPRDPLPRSTAVNATYSEVTARTRVCLHIDITAGRDSGDREGGGDWGRERAEISFRAYSLPGSALTPSAVIW